MRKQYKNKKGRRNPPHKGNLVNRWSASDRSDMEAAEQEAQYADDASVKRHLDKALVDFAKTIEVLKDK